MDEGSDACPVDEPSSPRSSPGTTSDELMDYVTCGTGLVLRLLPDHPDLAVRAAAGRAVRRGAQGASSRTPWSRPRATSARPRPRRPSWPRATPTWSASSAARSPIRTSSPRPAPAAPTTSGRASRATSCAGAGARATTGSRASSIHRRAANGSGAATGSTPAAEPRRVLVVGGGPAGLEAARVAAERGHRVTLLERRAGTRRPVPAGRAPAVARPDHATCSRGTAGGSRRWAWRSGSGRRRPPPRSPAAGADEVVVATGARPARTGFQRALPLVDRLPGRGARRRLLDPRRARRHGRAGRTVSSSSTTSTTGAASGRRCTSPSPATT